MAERKPLIAGNWKCNLNHYEAIALVQKLWYLLPERTYDHVEVVVLPPFTDLRSVQTVIDSDKMLIGYGAQDLSVHDSGAYTGEVSGAMLATLGCSYAVVGHSERREYHHEDDALVAAKVQAAYRHQLTPILCVGEGLEVRRAGGQVAHATGQLRAALAGLSEPQVATLVVAYEPVWAIGTGETATPADAQQVCAALRATLAELHGDAVAAGVRVLYGGSVKPDNIAAIMAEPDVDGALVGGASLSPEEFAQVVRYREHAARPDPR